MTNIAVTPIVTAAFSFQASLEGTRIRVVLSGSADAEVQPLLPPTFRTLHAEAQRLMVREVLVDVHELFFMSSSCFKAFVSWMDLLNGRTAPAYQVHFIRHSNLSWQARSLDALRRMALASVVVDVFVEGRS